MKLPWRKKTAMGGNNGGYAGTLPTIELSAPGPTARDLTLKYNGIDITRGLRKITIESEASSANVVILECIPGKLEIDMPALLEVLARTDDDTQTTDVGAVTSDDHLRDPSDHN